MPLCANHGYPAWAVAASAALIMLLPGRLAAAEDSAGEAASYLEFQSLCRSDGGALWGRSLCGNLLVADPRTRRVWASRADQGGVLVRDGTGWVGRLPDGVGISNTALDWSGVHWFMVMSPLPEDARARRVLLVHEAWHGIQDELGLPMGPSDCAHLETEKGRTLMRLEMRALRTALLAKGTARWSAARDALLFRSARLAAFPAAAPNETSLDRNEGLAEYTGVRLGAGDGAHEYAADTLARFDSHPSLARSYAYATGPAWGLLLDARDPDWRVNLGAEAPADRLQRMLGAIPPPGGFDVAASRYGGAAIEAEERTRAAAAAARLVDLRRRFGTGPRLVLPLGEMRMEFDPNRVTPVEDLGTYYETLVVHDAWGELRAESGALINQDFSSVIVDHPSDDGTSGPGWTLKLNDGFRLGGRSTGEVRSLASDSPGS